MHLLRQFVNHNISGFKSLLDIGSGAGHWIDFYRSLGVEKAIGIEVSANCVEHLNQKYAGDENVSFYLGATFDVFEKETLPQFDQISGIGVLFHIVDDKELIACLEHFYKHLEPGGYLIVGSNFGHWPMNINTQVKFGKIVNKRLRSRY